MWYVCGCNVGCAKVDASDADLKDGLPVRITGGTESGGKGFVVQGKDKAGKRIFSLSPDEPGVGSACSMRGAGPRLSRLSAGSRRAGRSMPTIATEVAAAVREPRRDCSPSTSARSWRTVFATKMNERRRFLKVLAGSAVVMGGGCNPPPNTTSLSTSAGSTSATTGSGGGNGGAGGAASTTTGGDCTQNPVGQNIGTPSEFATEGLHIVANKGVIIGRDRARTPYAAPCRSVVFGIVYRCCLLDDPRWLVGRSLARSWYHCSFCCIFVRWSVYLSLHCPR